MHPTLRYELMMSHQQDNLRSAAGRRLAAEAKRTRATARPASGGPLAAQAVPVLRLRSLLSRLLPA
jgi:hypothetical protein